jgi:hypothetical protein
MSRDTDLDRLADSVTVTCRVNACLEELIDQPGTRHHAVAAKVTLTGSSPSWHAQAAYLVLDLQRLSRVLENRLRAEVSGTELKRGGSDHNTHLALQALLALAEAASLDATRETWRALDRWCQRGRVTLGEVEPMQRLPRLPGQPEPRCPYCTFATLRYQPLSGLVRCLNPTCLDGHERRPVARVELGPYSGSPILAWADGYTGLPGAAA